jgi:hypothetical protein
LGRFTQAAVLRSGVGVGRPSWRPVLECSPNQIGTFSDREHDAEGVLLIECECFGLLVSRDPYHIAHEREGSTFGCVVMNERASIESA